MKIPHQEMIVAIVIFCIWYPFSIGSDAEFLIVLLLALIYLRIDSQNIKDAKSEDKG